MNIKEIEGKTDAELDFDVENMKKKLFDVRFALATGTAANSAEIRDLRRSIARIRTIQQERILGIHGREPRQR